MKVLYEREADVLSVEIDPSLPIDDALEAGPFIVHMSADGRIALIEVLDASRVLAALVRAGLRDGGEYSMVGDTA
ncbi:MAG: DUF2283 domain-containing protein [Anaerolineae bacterium]|nr:DUF2283 domain-containing protein [Anaerolineae bacterium]